MFEFLKRKTKDVDNNQIEKKETKSNIDYLLQYTNSYLMYVKYIKALIDDTVEEECSKRLIKDTIAETKTIDLEDVHRLIEDILNIVKANIPIGFIEIVNFLFTESQIELMVNTKVFSYLKSNYTIYDNKVKKSAIRKEVEVG